MKPPKRQTLLLTLLMTSALFFSGAILQAQLPFFPDGKGGKAAETDTTAAKPIPPRVALSNTLKRVTLELEQLSLQTNLPRSVTGDYKKGKLQQIQNIVREHLETLTVTNAPQEIVEPPDLTGVTPPYSVILCDDFRKIRRTLQQTLAKNKEYVETTLAELDYQRKQLAARQQELRALNELQEVPSNKQLQPERLPFEIRLLGQVVELEQTKLKKARAESERLSALQESTNEQLDRLVKDLTFPDPEYATILSTLDQRDADLKRTEQDLLARFEETGDGQTTPEQRQATRQELNAIKQQLQRVPEDRETWERRFQLFTKKNALKENSGWPSEAKSKALSLERLARINEIKKIEIQTQMAQRPGPATVEPPAASALRALEDSRQAILRSLDLEMNAIADFELFSHSLSVSDLPGRLWEGAKTIWNHEITNIDDRPITLRKIFIALLIMVLGIRLVRWLSHILVSRILKRVRVEESTAVAISTLLFYSLAVMVFVTALGFAGIPLTLFAILGGALAIGLGFGSQNIINNFISGLILLVERPIRVGDMVEVDGTHGKVCHVGLRCTQVRTFNNVDILVPNSNFIETKVINWTLTDDKVKIALVIGVCYGSDTERVRTLMLQAATENEKVIKTPVPEVFFTDFGDNALMFRMQCWIRMKQPSDQSRVESALRFRIDAMFREENLIIAYPQRDLHLDTLKPLEIKMVSSGESAPEMPPSEGKS